MPQAKVVTVIDGPGSGRSSPSLNTTAPATPATGDQTPATGSQTPATGTQTPDPLLGPKPTVNHDALKSLAQRIQPSGEGSYELEHRRRRPSQVPEQQDASDTEAVAPKASGVPPELPNLSTEIILVMVCSAGLMLFSFLLGDLLVVQQQFRQALGIANSELSWLVGAFNVANGLSVVVSGSMTDLAPPKYLMVGAFVWLSAWNIVGAFTLTPARYVLFFVMRAMQGLAIGVLVSGSMSILGRVYKPGLRKNRVFSAMAAMAPFGFSLGALQGGALKSHLPWIFGSNAIITGLCAVAAFYTIPDLRPAADGEGKEAPSMRQFDFLGAACAVVGCVCLLFGLTQGSVTAWSPYTYAMVIVGVLALVALFFVEGRVARPLIPTRLWTTKGFTPLMIAYFLGFGSFFGAWQFYAIQFWLHIQKATPLAVALYHIPNAVVGVLATWIVSRTLHRVPGHYIYATSMVAFTMGPAFFLPQTANTMYWALSFPGMVLVTFGPDLAFAAASIFITSNVARSYQGSAGSLLVTNQNLSSAILTSIADSIGNRVDQTPSGEIGLKGLHAIWWFALACQLCAALVVLIWVRIPKEEEKEHVT